jgi:hypothetical protein
MFWYLYSYFIHASAPPPGLIRSPHRNDTSLWVGGGGGGWGGGGGGGRKRASFPNVLKPMSKKRISY